MADQVDQLLRDYIREHRAGGEADPLAYLERAPEPERDELAALIDAYLAQAPRAAWDAAAHEQSGGKALVDSLMRSLEGEAGMWPALLPRLRNRARLRRKELAARLAEALGVSGKEAKVEGYYHEMEQGLLPSSGVSDRVLEALGSLLGESAERLREAGSAIGVGGAKPGAGEVFARSIPGEFAERGYEAEGPGMTIEPVKRQEKLDEVDRLFRGDG